MNQDSPDLKFGPTTERIGLTAAGISAFDNLYPAGVVRELLQNSLDAAVYAGVETARVSFRLSEIETCRIPGIASYKQTFRHVKQSLKGQAGGELVSKAASIVKQIEKALKSKTLKVLTVLDNGIGLDESRMEALLSDGISKKDSGATGTYGNGHSTAIPTSDLRYVLYGGLTKDGTRIGSGQAVLATHHISGDRQLRSRSGFFVKDVTTLEIPKADELPELISNVLDDLAESSDHGAAIIIPAFNHFEEEDKSLWKIVSEAAATNFFVAIGLEKLVVEVREPGASSAMQVLNKASLYKVLAEHRDQQRAKSRGFISGQKAFQAYRAFSECRANDWIDTKHGMIQAHVREDPSLGSSRVGLCRNGMWVTDNIPGLKNKFSDLVPFWAVLTIHPGEGGALYEAIRLAEGPLHHEISFKRLKENVQKKRLKDSFKAIADWLKSNARTLATNSYFVDGYLSIDQDGSGGGGSLRAGYGGKPVVLSSSPVRPHPQKSGDPDGDGNPSKTGTGKHPPNRNWGRRRPALPNVFRAVSRPVDTNRQRIHITFDRDFDRAEMRLVVDEAIDPTCVRPAQDQYAPAFLSNIRVDDKAVESSDLSRWPESDGEVVGVRLGDRRKDDKVVVETDFSPSGDFHGLSKPSLRIELQRVDAEDQAGQSDSGTERKEN